MKDDKKEKGYWSNCRMPKALVHKLKVAAAIADKPIYGIIEDMMKKCNVGADMRLPQ